ncbi:DUF4391 domain-containing protein [Clostridium sp.]|uniref:DUF4391 domain-containing protein n=1 Tax=Clostridium sp. TaxID=1506 RepID=UPI00321666E4
MDIGKYLSIPASCSVENTIYKKLFYDNADLSTKDKNLFVDNINKITWVYCMKPETINIQVYEDEDYDYSEIEVIDVELTENISIKRIAEIIMRTIPYPILLIFRLDNKLQLHTAHQRINKNDSSKNTIEEFISTEWISEKCVLFEKLNIKNMRCSNYYTLYSDIVDAISVFNLNSKISVEDDVTGEEARKITKQIEDLEQKISILKSKLNKETQFNRKMELNIQIKKLGEQKNKLVGGKIDDRS